MTEPAHWEYTTLLIVCPYTSGSTRLLCSDLRPPGLLFHVPAPSFCCHCLTPVSGIGRLLSTPGFLILLLRWCQLPRCAGTGPPRMSDPRPTSPPPVGCVGGPHVCEIPAHPPSALGTTPDLFCPEPLLAAKWGHLHVDLLSLFQLSCSALAPALNLLVLL